jgi:hypothetical protein
MNPIDIAWLVSNVKTADPTELLTTELASSRMRAGVSIQHLSQAPGLRVLPLNLVGTDALPRVAFMSKYVHDSGANLYMHDGGQRWDFWTQQVARIKAAGGKLVVDYTDNHLAGNDMRTRWYTHILGQVDGFVVPSEKMAINARQYWQGPLWLIPEPIEVPIIAPRSRKGGDKVHAVWYGHNSNLPYLYRFIQQEMHLCPPMDLKILTNFLDQNILKAAIAKGPKSASYGVGKWSVASMLEVAQSCDVAVIPSDPADLRKNGASANRVVTALALGLVPIVDVIDSYRPFSDFFVDLSQRDILLRVQSDLIQLKERVIRAQTTVIPTYTVDRVGPLWAGVVNDLIQSDSSRS